jgi:molecular chaperone HtpG
MDGVCHWLALGTRYDDEEYLVSFNMSNEMFVTTHIPLDMDDSFNIRFARKHLVVLNGYIAMVSNYSQMTTFNISILGEIGKKDSWTKLFVVGPMPCVEHPIGTWKNGNIFFRKENSELVWFDISTQKIENLGLKSQERFGKIVTYRKSHCLIE